MNNERLPDFAPVDPTDGRKLGDWPSKYPPAARRAIRFDACYLAVLLFSAPITMMILWLEYPKDWLALSDGKFKPILKYGFAWLSGGLGGTVFGVKWLYHSVARQIWHLDRRLWRIFTPHISAVLGSIFVVVISSGMLRIFDSQAIESLSLVISVAFLVGLFSDSAVAKLSEVAEILFGVSRAKEKHKGGSTPDETSSTSERKDPESSEIVPGESLPNGNVPGGVEG
jgi:hypothetical protein